MFTRSVVRTMGMSPSSRTTMLATTSLALRRSAQTSAATAFTTQRCCSANTSTAAAAAPTTALFAVRRFEHTNAGQPTTPSTAASSGSAGAAEASRDDLSTQLNDLMDSFAEARELIKDAMESVGTTYFADDMEDAEAQSKDVLKRWADIQSFLETSGQTGELQKLRNMHDLKIKQMEAELETVRDAGGSG